MRKLGDLEVILRGDEIKRMAARILRKAEGISIPTPAVLLERVQQGIFHAWEHSGTLGLVQVHCEGERILARVAYIAGDMTGVLRWYDAWEAECRQHHVDEMRVCGRCGWIRVNRKFGLGFEPTDGNDWAKRLR